MKGLIVVDIPRNCMKCRMSDNRSVPEEECVYCKVSPEGINPCRIGRECYEKPDWCPIKSIEEIKNYKNYTLLVDEHFKVGWNSCLDAISGDKNGKING